ncbi:hypothetical protein [Methanosarcina mazei]|uniref:Uncharacterized protein n=1 Tax=Methanosarcina mazei Tuc01 TaxID=1236903 RepID=M1QFU7_METMZ|nr:hypothetical protein [Methanosarcina mazei]AGF95874.1 hypothetical protein MmTuc01_0436 [Methanosarcina mazei Tuc01]MDO5841250.1 hypothetical protein [Methanosarcina mazei]MDY0246578.1 hypothetical protein [Methanosarcina mazei]
MKPQCKCLSCSPEKVEVSIEETLKHFRIWNSRLLQDQSLANWLLEVTP